jgi:hypothetical protein
MTTSTSTQLRTEVRDILLEFDRRFVPGSGYVADALRHAYRLRFALARYEEQAHAAVMQSTLYSEGRLRIAASILELDIARARNFLRSLVDTAASTAASTTVTVDDAEEVSLQEAA